MTIHPLHAGSGYTYLTREVASADQRLSRGEKLSDYYTAEGNPPGIWGGRLAEEWGVSGEVTEDQMRALFGEGLHPNAEAMISEYIASKNLSPLGDRTALAMAGMEIELGRKLTADELTEVSEQAAREEFAAQRGREPGTAGELERFMRGQKRSEHYALRRLSTEAIDNARLGRRFMTFENETALTRRTREELAAGRRAKGGALTAAQREAIKDAVARSEFTKDVGRPPANHTELTRFVAAQARKMRQPVSGFDCVFTPQKSVSVLWGLADTELRGVIERAHHAAFTETMNWLEDNIAYTRIGAGGPGQIDTKGLGYTKFDHRDNRCGDPNLHTHVTISTKVLSEDGKWRALDARVLYKATVAASERYNTAMENALSVALGVTWEEVSHGPGKRPVRELVGIPEQLRTEFSRRDEIEARLKQLVDRYRVEHGKTPSKTVQVKLAQQATLETRDQKPPIMAFGEQLAEWRARAAGVLGDEQAVDQVVAATINRQERPQIVGPETVDPHTIGKLAVDRVSTERSTWQAAHIEAEIHRQLKPYVFNTSDPVIRERVETLRERSLEAALGPRNSVRLSITEDASPKQLRRSDGMSIFTVARTSAYTSETVLAAEDRLVSAATNQLRAMLPAEQAYKAALVASEARGRKLNTGQERLAKHLLFGGHQLEVGVGPAGTGKTTAMRVVTDTWIASGREVVALAPSAVAAANLASELENPAIVGRTIADVLFRNEKHGDPKIPNGSMLLVDEAGMASALDIDKLVRIADERGAIVRLIGDPGQLAAVENGGALRLLAHRTNAPELTEIHRFVDPEEGPITLRVRDGDTTAIGWYHAKGRVYEGCQDELPDMIYRDWKKARDEGTDGIMISRSNEVVAMLNQRARADLIAAGEVDDSKHVTLRDGLHAGTGDTVLTRQNDSRLRVVGARNERVRNGDLWTVQSVHDDGSMTVEHREHHGHIRLPAEYLSTHTELGYASTVHRAQGLTVDGPAFQQVDAGMDRNLLYTASTRSRTDNRLYVPNDVLIDVERDHQPIPLDPADALLKDIVSRDGTQYAALDQQQMEQEQPTRLDHTVPAYHYAAELLEKAELDYALRQAVDDDTADRITADPAWNTMRTKLDKLRAAGGDPAEALQHVAAQRELYTADSEARVLHHRLDAHLSVELATARAANVEWADQHAELLETHLPGIVDAARTDAAANNLIALARSDEDPAAVLADAARRPAEGFTDELFETNWADRYRQACDYQQLGHAPNRAGAPDWIPAPREEFRDIDPTLAGWLDQQYAGIQDRTRTLGDTTADQAPGWAVDALGPVPEDEDQLRAWKVTAAQAAAYREQHKVADPTSPLGPRPADTGPTKAAWDHTQALIDSYNDQRQQVEEQHRRANEEQRRQQRLADQRRQIDSQRRSTGPQNTPGPDPHGPRRGRGM